MDECVLLWQIQQETAEAAEAAAAASVTGTPVSLRHFVWQRLLTGGQW